MADEPEAKDAGTAPGGTARGRAEPGTARGRAEPGTARGRAEPGTARGRAEQEREPSVSFSEFVLGLGANAAHILGADDDPVEVAARADLVSAAQYIDIISMLQEKTRGNLSQEEQNLLDSMLYDLRMRYLEVARTQADRT